MTTPPGIICLSYGLSLATTFAIEVPIIYWLFRKYEGIDRNRIVKGGFMAQMITHPASFLVIPTLATYLNIRFHLGGPWWVTMLNSFVFYEFVIPIVEGFFYARYLRPGSAAHAYLFSLIANLASWGLGTLIDDRQVAEMIYRGVGGS